MPTTVEILSSLLRDGDNLRTRLRVDYFQNRALPGFDIHAFLERFTVDITNWIAAVRRILETGYNSPTPVITFNNANSSTLREAGTNVQWGNLHALIDAKVRVLTEIVRVSDPRTMVPMTDPRSVFLVHGRGTEWNTRIREFLERGGYTVVLLEEQANLGATLIEKIERHAEVGAAIIVFTADDVGCLSVELAGGAGLVPRTRQNVLIELGFFFGRLGRTRVCILKEPQVEVPSDLSGIVYSQIEIADNPRWQEEVLRDLAAMGLRA